MSTASAAESRGLANPAFETAWQRYLATLEEMRTVLEGTPQFRDNPQHRGMAWRQLLEVQAMAYNYTMAPRTAHPRVYRNTIWQTEHYSIGGNGPDFDYRIAFLDGAQSYRLHGRMCDSRLLLAQLNSAPPGSPGARCVANYDFTDFTLAPDGSFEVILSAERHPGNWIALVRESGYQWLFFRPTVEAWDQHPAELFIERIGELPDHRDAEEYSEEFIARRLGVMTDFVRYMIGDWVAGFVKIVLAKSGGRTNVFIPLQTIAESKEEGSPSAEYLQCVFEVEDGEALILEFDEAPEGPYWSLQLYDIWQRSLAFRTRQTTLNGNQMAKDEDGRIRIVLCRRDPGVANWLDNAGYVRGEVTWRNYKAARIVGHRIHRVPFAELDRHLPATTRRITPEERSRELERRRLAYLRRHGE